MSARRIASAAQVTDLDSEAKFHAVFGLSPTILFITGLEDGRIREVNDTFLRATGYAREETPFPIAYPTAARPQAWAAGTPILLVRLLLGLSPDRARQRLMTTVEDDLPSWLDGLRVEGIRAFGRSWSVAVERGTVAVSEGA